jgi:hypothetical protein
MLKLTYYYHMVFGYTTMLFQYYHRDATQLLQLLYLYRCVRTSSNNLDEIQIRMLK